MVVNLVITTNHILGPGYQAMLKVAKSVLENDRCFEPEPYCMVLRVILELKVDTI
jgi:phosphoenolpyruvate phosphomutase / 2-hydroxyethylphosphonate cytidylyltransferase